MNHNDWIIDQLNEQLNEYLDLNEANN